MGVTRSYRTGERLGQELRQLYQRRPRWPLYVALSVLSFVATMLVGLAVMD